MIQNVFPGSHASACEMPSRRGSRILIAEDDPSLLRLLSVVLSDEFDVEVTSSVEGAVEKLRASAFDLVVLDSFARYPELYGPTQPVRDAAGNARVVLFTGYSVKGEAVAAAGFAGVIAKSFDLDTLATKIRAFLTGTDAFDGPNERAGHFQARIVS